MLVLCSLSLFLSRPTPPRCEHNSAVHSVLDSSCLALTHCGYSHIEVCNGPVQNLMNNSPDLHSNVILEGISSLRIVGINSLSFRYPQRKQSKGYRCGERTGQ